MQKFSHIFFTADPAENCLNADLLQKTDLFHNFFQNAQYFSSFPVENPGRLAGKAAKAPRIALSRYQSVFPYFRKNDKMRKFTRAKCGLYGLLSLYRLCPENRTELDFSARFPSYCACTLELKQCDTRNLRRMLINNALFLTDNPPFAFRF